MSDSSTMFNHPGHYHKTTRPKKSKPNSKPNSKPHSKPNSKPHSNKLKSISNSTQTLKLQSPNKPLPYLKFKPKTSNTIFKLNYNINNKLFLS
jgi:hypothetical protein